jgi:hypothetical protein
MINSVLSKSLDISICNEEFFMFTFYSAKASKDKWTVLKGKLCMTTSAAKVLIYLEGPPEGIDLLASYFSILPLGAEPVSICHTCLFISSVFYW